MTRDKKDEEKRCYKNTWLYFRCSSSRFVSDKKLQFSSRLVAEVNSTAIGQRKDRSIKEMLIRKGRIIITLALTVRNDF